MMKWNERSKKNKISFILYLLAWILIALAAYIVYVLGQKNTLSSSLAFFALSSSFAGNLVKSAETCTKKELIKKAIVTIIFCIIIIFVI